MAPTDPGKLFHRVAFDKPKVEDNGYGGKTNGWDDPANAYECWAGYLYQRGNETIEAARLSGRNVIKVQIRSNSKSKLISSEWRMRDLRVGTEYNVRSIDAVSDRQWVYLIVESGVAI